MRQYIECSAHGDLEDECCICLEEFQNRDVCIVTDCCGNYIHRNCCNELEVCPLCRGEMKVLVNNQEEPDEPEELEPELRLVPLMNNIPKKYAVNYNKLRIMSGMGGLGFSN